MSDPLSSTYLYGGAVALLTTETRVIVGAIQRKSTFGQFMKLHATSNYLWAMTGSLFIVGGLLYFTGVQLAGWSSALLIALLGNFGGLLTFRPLESIKPAPVEDERLASVLTEIDGKKVVNIQSAQNKDVREALFKEKGVSEEKKEESNIIVKALKRKAQKMLPSLRNTLVKAIDNVVLEGMGYETERFIVMPEKRQKVIQDIEAVQTLKIDMGAELDKIVEATERQEIVTKISTKIKGDVLLEKLLLAYKTGAMEGDPLKVLQALFVKYRTKFFEGKKVVKVDNDFFNKSSVKTKVDKTLGELMGINPEINPMVLKKQIVEWIN